MANETQVTRDGLTRPKGISMSTMRKNKIDAIRDCRAEGASTQEIYRLSSLNGWDEATIEAGLSAARRDVAIRRCDSARPAGRRAGSSPSCRRPTTTTRPTTRACARGDLAGVLAGNAEK
jgi:hypothetical protein